MKRIVFTVTNELVYDQRMIRICSSLCNAGYDVILIGRSFQNAAALTNQPFKQKRIFCLFKTGKLFYIEYNLKLFIKLLFIKTDAITAIDLDTIIPALWASKIKFCKRFYDAHELFTEMKEVVNRPSIHRFWSWVERKTVPAFKYAYTVNQPIADIFKKKYGIQIDVIQNITRYDSSVAISNQRENIILYQGAVNEGRCFETLIPAIKNIDCKLIICGDGNFMQHLKKLIQENQVSSKVTLLGKIEPSELKSITSSAKVGITLFEAESTNNYLSLANRFFDYIHAGTPQLCVDFPAYHTINAQHEVAYLIERPTIENIANGLNKLLHDPTLWSTLHQNCISAAPVLCWQQEEKKLIAFYQQHLG